LKYLGIDDRGLDDASADSLGDVEAKDHEATKLKNAAQNTANCGRNTRVETMVAIEILGVDGIASTPSSVARLGQIYFARRAARALRAWSRIIAIGRILATGASVGSRPRTAAIRRCSG
jgi:hypothetical protein